MYGRIVVPLDGSDIAQSALTQARDMARTYDAPLFLIRVTDAPVPVMARVAGAGASTQPFAVGSPPRSEGDGEAQRYIDGMVRQLQVEGFRVAGTVISGRPADEIVSALIEGDLLVMSSTGKTGVKRFLLGSVAEQVVKQSSISVFVVRS